MKWTSLSLLPLVVALGTAGCEISDCPPEGEQTEDTEEVNDGQCVQFKSLSKFLGNTEVDSTAWASGANIVIDSVNGKIEVIEGQSDQQVSATVKPFVFRAHDTPDAEAVADMEKLQVRIEEDSSGNTVVQTERSSGGRTTLGADIIVELPIGFDGKLQITQNNGAIDVAGLDNGASLTINSDNGGIDVTGGALGDVSIHGDNGGIDFTANGVTGVDVVSSGPGGISFGVGQLPDAGTGQIIDESLTGDIALSLGAEGTYSVLATAGDGTVDFGTIPSACTEDVAAENSKTLTCGGGGFELTVDANSGAVAATVQ